MNTPLIKSISQEEVAKHQVSGNLPDKPNQASLYGNRVLTPQEIKEFYDKLPKLIVEYFNSLIAAIEADATDPNSISAKIGSQLVKGITLQDIFLAFANGELKGETGEKGDKGDRGAIVWYCSYDLTDREAGERIILSLENFAPIENESPKVGDIVITGNDLLTIVEITDGQATTVYSTEFDVASLQKQINKKLDKIPNTTTRTMVYVVDPNNNVSLMQVRPAYAPNSIVARDSTGRFNVLSPEDADNAVPKKYVDEGLAGKANKLENVQAYMQVMGVSQYNSETLVPVRTIVEPKTIVGRNEDGFFEVNSPLEANHPATKQYVDNTNVLVSAMQEQLTALCKKVTELESGGEKYVLDGTWNLRSINYDEYEIRRFKGQYAAVKYKVHNIELNRFYIENEAKYSDEEAVEYQYFYGTRVNPDEYNDYEYYLGSTDGDQWMGGNTFVFENAVVPAWFYDFIHFYGIKQD